MKPTESTPAGASLTRDEHARELARLIALGPEAQGDIDESLLRDNLQLSPLQRIAAASEAATQIEFLREAMRRAQSNA